MPASDEEAQALDPVAIHMLVVIFVVGPLLAAALLWRDRRIRKRAGVRQARLTPLGTFVLVTVVVALGAAIVLRQFYPASALGAWLRGEGALRIVAVACVAVAFAVEIVSRWLGMPTARKTPERED